MKMLKYFLDFYLNASIHVALAVYSLMRITEIYFVLNYNENLNYFVFFGTITGYNFVKYAGVAKLHHRSLTNSLRVIQVFSFICFLAMGYYMFKLALTTLYYTIPFIILTVLYAVPLLSGFDKTLREISYLKIIVVAVVWSGFTVLLPLLDANKNIETNAIFFMFQRIFIVVVLILPFDIRDVKYDAISLQTIPKKLGVEKTKKLGLTLMILSLVVENIISTSITNQAPFMIFFFLVIILLMRAKIDQSKYYSSFWVESLPIVWWLIHLGFHNF